MECNSANQVYIDRDIRIMDERISNFGVSFHIQYDFEKINQQCGVLGIDYEIKLARDGNVLFGTINCRYEFNVMIGSMDYIDGEISESVVRNCLKFNHDNIYDLIEDSLLNNGITYSEEYEQMRS